VQAGNPERFTEWLVTPLPAFASGVDDPMDVTIPKYILEEPSTGVVQLTAAVVVAGVTTSDEGVGALPSVTVALVEVA